MKSLSLSALHSILCLLILDISSLNAQIVSLPYATDFDAGLPGGWINDSTDSGEDWRSSLQILSTYGPDAIDHSSGSGAYLWVDDSSPHSAATQLISPPFDLVGSNAPQASFWLWSQNENPLNPETILHVDAEQNGVWTQDIIPALASQGAHWVYLQADLSAFSGDTLRLRLRAEEIGNGFQHDIAIDDFSVFDQSPLDVGVIALTSPRGRGCFSSAETLRIRLVNYGTAAIDFAATMVSLSVHISGASTQSLSEVIPTGLVVPGDTFSYTLSNRVDLSNPGIHHLAISSQVTGDGNTLNDTVYAQIETDLLLLPPFLEDFEAFPLVPADSLANGWYNTGSTGRQWIVGLAGQPYSAQTGPINNHTPAGNQYVFAEASPPALTGDTFLLHSPCFDLSNSPQSRLEFWYHMYGQSMGSLDVEVGATGIWTPIFSIQGQQQNSENDPWKRVNLDLSGYGDTIQLRFRAIRGTSFASDIALDDIQIFDAPAIDLTLNEMISPLPISCLDSSQTLSVNLQNMGAAAIDFSQDTAVISMSVTGPTSQSYMVRLDNGVLAPLANLPVVLTNNAPLFLAGEYTLNAIVSVSGDGNLNNDTLLARRIQPEIKTLPLPLVDFTQYTGSNLSTFFPGWSEAEGEGRPLGSTSNWTSDDWANTPGDPLGVAARIRYSDNNDRDWLLSPPFLATAHTVLCFQLNLRQSFDMSAGSLGSDDSLSIMISTDCGASFSLLFSYTQSNSISNTVDTLDLSAFAGENVILGFYASEGTIDDPEDTDLFLDNLHIKELFSHDIELIAVNAPQSACTLNSTTPVSIVYTNRGTQSLANPQGGLFSRWNRI